MAATPDLKRRIAVEVAAGATVTELARTHSYSVRGMRELLKRHDVRALTAAERAKLETLLDQHRAQLVLTLGLAIENIQAAIADPRHPRCLETSRWLLDRVMGTKPDRLEPVVEERLTRAEAEELRLSFDRLSGMLSGQECQPLEESPYLKDGKDAIPHDARARRLTERAHQLGSG